MNLLSATTLSPDLSFEVVYPIFSARVTLLTTLQLQFEIAQGSFAKLEVVKFEATAVRPGVFLVSWQEADGASVVQLLDFHGDTVCTHATLADKTLLRLQGRIKRIADTERVGTPEQNKALVLDAMVSLFIRRDVSVIERLYGAPYLQHNPQMPNGHAVLREALKSLPAHFSYQPGRIVADNDLVMIHGRLTGWGEHPQVVVDIFRIDGGKLVEHWDVIQDEVPADRTVSGLPMFTLAT